MEQEYWTECEACEVETQVMVIDEEEIPQHCPMCGFSTIYEPFDSSD